jgi:hypothetical protein
MVLLGDVAQVEPRFGLFGVSVNVCASPVSGLPQTYHRLNKFFGRTRCNS